MDNNKMANVFISDEGEVIMTDIYELKEEDQLEIARAEATVKKIEDKYKTEDIWKMMEKGISLKALVPYICAKRDLKYYW